MEGRYGERCRRIKRGFGPENQAVRPHLEGVIILAFTPVRRLFLLLIGLLALSPAPFLLPASAAPRQDTAQEQAPGAGHGPGPGCRGNGRRGLSTFPGLAERAAERSQGSRLQRRPAAGDARRAGTAHPGDRQRPVASRAESRVRQIRLGPADATADHHRAGSSSARMRIFSSGSKKPTACSRAFSWPSGVSRATTAA